MISFLTFRFAPSSSLQDPPANLQPFTYTLVGHMHYLTKESKKRYKTFLQFGGGFGVDYRTRFGEYGVWKARPLSQFQSWTGLINWGGRAKAFDDKSARSPVGLADSGLDEDYECVDDIFCQVRVPLLVRSPLQLFFNSPSFLAVRRHVRRPSRAGARSPRWI